MKTTGLLFFFFGTTLGCVFAQQLSGVPHLSPKLGRELNYSAEGKKEWLKHDSICTVLWEKESEQLTTAERKFRETCSETDLDYYEAIGGGCSWYCGGGPDTVKVSSFLAAQKGNSYDASSASDLSFETAWVEGVPGTGVGESIVFTFQPQSPRVTDIIIANGYVKSEKAWKENGRVKTLQLSINGKAVAVLELEDSRKEQVFSFDPIGYERNITPEQLAQLPEVTLQFTILETYPGTKYQDTALSEIYFDGIDVH